MAKDFSKSKNPLDLLAYGLAYFWVHAGERINPPESEATITRKAIEHTAKEFGLDTAPKTSRNKAHRQISVMFDAADNIKYRLTCLFKGLDAARDTPKPANNSIQPK